MDKYTNTDNNFCSYGKDSGEIFITNGVCCKNCIYREKGKLYCLKFNEPITDPYDFCMHCEYHGERNDI